MTRSLLLRALIIKSVVDTILVSAIAVGSYMASFPPYFHGWGEATANGIAGWAVNNQSPWDRVEVQLFIDGQFIQSGTANLSRPDVAQAGWAKDEWHGYVFPLSKLDAGNHEARVYAMHESSADTRRTLQLLGYPIRFLVQSDGKIVDLRHRPNAE